MDDILICAELVKDAIVFVDSMISEEHSVVNMLGIGYCNLYSLAFYGE